MSPIEPAAMRDRFHLPGSGDRVGDRELGRITMLSLLVRAQGE
jgi:hypothetical protein